MPWSQPLIKASDASSWACERSRKFWIGLHRKARLTQASHVPTLVGPLYLSASAFLPGN